jgi:hypothetical protein
MAQTLDDGPCVPHLPNFSLGCLAPRVAAQPLFSVLGFPTSFTCVLASLVHANARGTHFNWNIAPRERSHADRNKLLVPLPRSCVDGHRYVSLQVVAQRMKSVGNIQKITAAMKMVAASRLKGAQMKMEKSRGLVQPLLRLLGDVPGTLISSWSFFLFILRDLQAHIRLWY